MIRRVFLALLVFGLVACGDDGTGDDGTGVEDIVGTYVLRSIDGEELPVTGLIAGSLTLKQDMTCSLSQTVRLESVGAVFTGIRAGTYTFNSGALTLTFESGNSPLVLEGSISGSTLTLPRSGQVYVLQK